MRILPDPFLFVCLFHNSAKVFEMRFLATILLCLLASSAMAQTTFDLSSGSSSVTKTITKAMGVVRPLHVSSNVYGKLILEPGAVLEMPAGGSIQVQFGGTLDARGTAAEPVTIRAQAGVSWQRIITSYRATASRPQILATHTNISGAIGGTLRTAIEAQHAVLMLDNVSFTMPRADASGRGYTAISLGPNITTSTGQLLDCVGAISNCKLIGMQTGILCFGDLVDIIDCEAINCKEPYVFQPYATREKPYHFFSVGR